MLKTLIDQLPGLSHEHVPLSTSPLLLKAETVCCPQQQAGREQKRLS